VNLIRIPARYLTWLGLGVSAGWAVAAACGVISPWLPAASLMFAALGMVAWLLCDALDDYPGEHRRGRRL
jgi:hypothetical protein